MFTQIIFIMVIFVLELTNNVTLTIGVPGKEERRVTRVTE